MPRYVVILTLFVAALVSAACGGKASPKEASPAGSAPATTASNPWSNTTQGVAAGAAAASALRGKFCADWRQNQTKTQPIGAGAASPPSAADMKANFETTAAFLKALSEHAPAEVKSDFQVISTYWSDYSALMAKNNYDFMRSATDPELPKVMARSEEVGKASSNIDAWMKKNCA